MIQSVRPYAVRLARSLRLTRPLRAIRSLIWPPPPAEREQPVAASAGIAPKAAVDSTFEHAANGRRIFIDPDDQRAQAMIAADGNFNPKSLMMWRLLCAEREWTHVV